MYARILLALLIGAAVSFAIPLPHLKQKTVGDFYRHYCNGTNDASACAIRAQDAWNAYEQGVR